MLLVPVWIARDCCTASNIVDARRNRLVGESRKAHLLEEAGIALEIVSNTKLLLQCLA